MEHYAVLLNLNFDSKVLIINCSAVYENYKKLHLSDLLNSLAAYKIYTKLDPTEQKPTVHTEEELRNHLKTLDPQSELAILDVNQNVIFDSNFSS